VASALEDLAEMTNIWSRTVLLFMSSSVTGKTYEQRAKLINNFINSPKSPGTLRWLLDKVRDRKLSLEYDEVDFQSAYGGIRF
jgi:hypothetical protein